MLSSRLDPVLNQNHFTSAYKESFSTFVWDPLKEEITINDVMAAVKLLKCKKSAGHDGLTAEHIKYGGTTICKWLTKILNRISTLEEIPASMKNYIVTGLIYGVSSLV